MVADIWLDEVSCCVGSCWLLTYYCAVFHLFCRAVVFPSPSATISSFFIYSFFFLFILFFLTADCLACWVAIFCCLPACSWRSALHGKSPLPCCICNVDLCMIVWKVASRTSSPRIPTVLDDLDGVKMSGYREAFTQSVNTKRGTYGPEQIGREYFQISMMLSLLALRLDI